MASELVAERIRRFNDNRERERLRRKYKAMRKGPFTFLRGTCHLFYEDWPRSSPLNQTPLAWICGDLHLENFGSYRGDNRLVYFDVNDFDEAVLAPCLWDVTRALTSTMVAMIGQRRPAERRAACNVFLDAYCTALRNGKALWVEPETAIGIVKGLFDGLQQRSRVQLLAAHCQVRNGQPKLRLNKRTLPICAADRRKVVSFMKRFAATQPNPKFFRTLDVKRRVAGTGSLGIERYVVLVEGNGSPARNFLLDLKAAAPSSLEPYLTVAQPDWPTEAARVVTIENRMQAVSQAHLHAVKLGSTAFVLRELQPVEDKLALDGKRTLRAIDSALFTMGEVTAWAHLRGSGRQGSATADALVELGSTRKWRRFALEYAAHYTRQVELDYAQFRQAWSAGFFDAQLAARPSKVSAAGRSQGRT